jgi:hypothetical protein
MLEFSICGLGNDDVQYKAQFHCIFKKRRQIADVLERKVIWASLSQILGHREEQNSENLFHKQEMCQQDAHPCVAAFIASAPINALLILNGEGIR